MMKHLSASVTTIFLVLTGCQVGPDYTPPQLNTPAAWSGAAASPNMASESAPDAHWWTVLEDSQLTSLIAQAFAANHSLEEAAARVREARALRSVAGAALKPRVNTAAQYQRSTRSENEPGLPTGMNLPFIIEPVNIPRETNLYQVGFDAGWELDFFGGNQRRAEAAGARAEAALDSYRGARLSVAAEVARNYVELRGAQRQLAVLRENLGLQEKTLDLMLQRHEHGLAPGFAVDQVRAQLLATRSAVPEAEAGMRAAAYRIAVLCGEPPAALLDTLLAPAPLPHVPDLVPVGLPGDLLRRRPDLRAAERQLHAALADIGVATADLYPRFSLTGQLGLRSGSFANWMSSSSAVWQLGPEIAWPVFQGGRIRGNIEAAEERYNAALAAYKQHFLTALGEVETALTRYVHAYETRERVAEAVAAQDDVVETAQAAYEGGVATFLTVLDAQRRKNELEQQQAEAETALTVTVVALYKALGGGWETQPSPMRNSGRQASREAA
jgi:NodT family efflux transporter outer membrane factor (OMF) lipoprotein